MTLGDVRDQVARFQPRRGCGAFSLVGALRSSPDSPIPKYSFSRVANARSVTTARPRSRRPYRQSSGSGDEHSKREEREDDPKKFHRDPGWLGERRLLAHRRASCCSLGNTHQLPRDLTRQRTVALGGPCREGGVVLWETQ